MKKVGSLVQIGTLGVGELLVLHGLFKSRYFFSKETLPGREVDAFEECKLDAV